MIIWFLSFINMVYYICWFLYVKLTLHSWDKSHLIMVYNPFYILLASVCQYFKEDFYVYIHKTYWSTGLIEWVGKFPPILFVIFILIWSLCSCHSWSEMSMPCHSATPNPTLHLVPAQRLLIPDCSSPRVSSSFPEPLQFSMCRKCCICAW